jgi:hypothetical protein
MAAYDYLDQVIVATALIQPHDDDSFYNPVSASHYGYAYDGNFYLNGVQQVGHAQASWFTEPAGPYRGDGPKFPTAGLVLLSPVALTILDQSQPTLDAHALPLWMQFLFADLYALANNFDGLSRYRRAAQRLDALGPRLRGRRRLGVLHAGRREPRGQREQRGQHDGRDPRLQPGHRLPRRGDLGYYVCMTGWERLVELYRGASPWVRFGFWMGVALFLLCDGLTFTQRLGMLFLMPTCMYGLVELVTLLASL